MWRQYLINDPFAYRIGNSMLLAPGGPGSGDWGRKTGAATNYRRYLGRTMIAEGFVGSRRQLVIAVN